MHDIKYIRENPTAFDKALARRGVSSLSSEILKLDEARRAAQTEMQEAQATRNDLSKQVGQVKREGGNADDLMQKVGALKDKLAELETQEKEYGEKLFMMLAEIPNVLDAEVPDGADEDANKEIRRVGEPAKIENPKQHYELGEDLGLMDFEIAATLSGSRFSMLMGDLAKLERAIGNFMLDTHTGEFGYTEVSPPLLVRDPIMFGTGQLPKFGDDLFKTTTGHWLIPTAEVPLTNMVHDDIVGIEELPLRVTARTPCFRAEAGSAGKDTRGILRQHQFYKVELVSITTPDQSKAEHERMTECAETVLKRLEIPYRTVILCSGDTGFGAQKTYDIEAWLPGQNTYREISSCSNCGDFQARRMNARFRNTGEKNTQFLHTLNGSGLAVGRTLIAIMENFQNPDGSITLPAVLHPYMGGQVKIDMVSE